MSHRKNTSPSHLIGPSRPPPPPGPEALPQFSRPLFSPCSKTALCRQRVMELLPKVEGVVQKMAESEQVLMGLQEKRQRELWNLLKVACVRTTCVFGCRTMSTGC